MQAVTIVPRRPGSLSLESMDEPPAQLGAVLARSAYAHDARDVKTVLLFED
jgi:hypothetical protein